MRSIGGGSMSPSQDSNRLKVQNLKNKRQYYCCISSRVCYCTLTESRSLIALWDFSLNPLFGELAERKQDSKWFLTSIKSKWWSGCKSLHLHSLSRESNKVVACRLPRSKIGYCVKRVNESMCLGRGFNSRRFHHLWASSSTVQSFSLRKRICD